MFMTVAILFGAVCGFLAGYLSPHLWSVSERETLSHLCFASFIGAVLGALGGALLVVLRDSTGTPPRSTPRAGANAVPLRDVVFRRWNSRGPNIFAVLCFAVAICIAVPLGLGPLDLVMLASTFAYPVWIVLAARPMNKTLGIACGAVWLLVGFRSYLGPVGVLLRAVSAVALMLGVAIYRPRGASAA